MTREEELDPLAPLGSYAGAMGIPQFMPTSFRAYAVDGDGDGHRDLWGDWSDVFASVGNYLKVHGWRSGRTRHGHGRRHWRRPERSRDPEARSVDDRGLRCGHAASSSTRGLPDDAAAVLIELDGAARSRVSRRLRELLRDHALQPQRAVRERGQRPRRGRAGAGRARRAAPATTDATTRRAACGRHCPAAATSPRHEPAHPSADSPTPTPGTPSTDDRSRRPLSPPPRAARRSRLRSVAEPGRLPTIQ